MGQASGEFVKYPKTSHLYNPELYEYIKPKDEEDKYLSKSETEAVLSRDDCEYVWESKLDGTNVGVSFSDGKLFLQNRGHELSAGEHPQYNLFRNWAYTVLLPLQEALGDRYIMFGEWVYAKHTVEYRSLPHYFFEFDIWDKKDGYFFDTELRQMLFESMVEKKMVYQVPIVHVGRLGLKEALALIDHAPYYGEDKPEGVYLKIEKDGRTIDRYKLVRASFVQTIIEGEDHWSHKAMVINQLAHGVDITRKPTHWQTAEESDTCGRNSIKE